MCSFLHDRTGRLEMSELEKMMGYELHDRTGRLENQRQAGGRC